MRELKIEFRKSVTIVFLIICLCILGSLTIFGAPAPPPGYDAKMWEKINDNRIEYDELSDLVAYRSPAYQAEEKDYYELTGDYKEAEKNLRSQIRDLKDDADKLEDSGDISGALANRDQAQSLERSADSFQDMIESFDKATAMMDLDHMKKEMTAGLQKMVSSYAQLELECRIAESRKNLAQANYELTLTQVALGMATETDAAAADKKVQEAQTSFISAQTSLTKQKQSICLAAGWNYDDNPEIGSVPPPDVEHIADIDKEADKGKAVGNNYALRQERHQGSGGGSASQNRRMRTIEENEQKLCMVIDRLYQEILSQKSSYDAAVSAFQKADIVYVSAQTEYQMGALGKLKFMEKETEYLNALLEKENADRKLRQAMEDYDWAVRGLAELE